MSGVKRVSYAYRIELPPTPATAGTNGSETSRSTIDPAATLTRVR